MSEISRRIGQYVVSVRDRAIGVEAYDEIIGEQLELSSLRRVGVRKLVKATVNGNVQTLFPATDRLVHRNERLDKGNFSSFAPQYIKATTLDIAAIAGAVYLSRNPEHVFFWKFVTNALIQMSLDAQQASQTFIREKMNPSNL